MTTQENNPDNRFKNLRSTLISMSDKFLYFNSNSYENLREMNLLQIKRLEYYYNILKVGFNMLKCWKI